MSSSQLHRDYVKMREYMRQAEKLACKEKYEKEYNERGCDVFLCNGERKSERWCDKHTVLRANSMTDWQSWMCFKAPGCRPVCDTEIVDSTRTMCLHCSYDKKIVELFVETTEFPTELIHLIGGYIRRR